MSTGGPALPEAWCDGDDSLQFNESIESSRATTASHHELVPRQQHELVNISLLIKPMVHIREYIKHPKTKQYIYIYIY